jgi:hypothetical protein
VLLPELDHGVAGPWLLRGDRDGTHRSVGVGGCGEKRRWLLSARTDSDRYVRERLHPAEGATVVARREHG